MIDSKKTKTNQAKCRECGSKAFTLDLTSGNGCIMWEVNCQRCGVQVMRGKYDLCEYDEWYEGYQLETL